MVRSMDPTRESRAEEIFAEALEVADSERPALLDRACASDIELRTRVEVLLRAHADGEQMFKTQELQTQMREIMASATQTPIGKRLSHYRIIETLGAGGMGEVYRARDENLPRDVAIKILPAGILADEQARRRFRKEAEALSKLNHQHIAVVFDLDNPEGMDFLVMELVEGKTLAHKLQGGPLPVEEVLRLASQIAEALDEAHKHGIVHRDLKPGNVGLTAREQVKLLDIGLARVLQRQTDSEITQSVTGTPAFAGTLPYMAPEQLRGTIPDHRCDLYALGVVLYEMTTGKRPFESDLPTALVDDILHKPPAPPSSRRQDLPVGLEQLILNCLLKDPERRYQSAHEVLEDLRRIGAPAGGFGLVRKREGRNRFSRRQLLALTGALAGLAAVLAALVATNVGGIRDKLLGRRAVGPVPIASIVALPSEVFAAPEDQFLTDAIARTLSTYLNQVDGLEVKMPPGSIEVEAVGKDFDRIAAAYGVGAVVVSTVTARAERLALNVQLVEAGTRRLIWSHEYDDSRQRFLEVVSAAAEGLRAALRPGAAPVAAVLGSSEVEIQFQRGLYLSNQYNNLHRSDDFERALAAFQSVLELDPKHAAAAAEIGNLYVYAYESGASFEQSVARMETWARRALEMDPRSARAWDVLCAKECFVWNIPAAFLTGLRAVSLAAGDAAVQNGFAHVLQVSSLRLALEGFKEAATLNPLYMHPPLNVAVILGWLGRPAEALAFVDRVLEVEEEMPYAMLCRAYEMILLGQTQQASGLLAKLEPMVAEGHLEPASVEAGRELIVLQTQGADGWHAEASNTLAWKFGEWLLAREMITMILARQGDVDAAFAALTHPGAYGRIPPYDWLMLCPDLRSLRSDPRFTSVTTQARAQFEAMLAALEEARSRGEFPPYLEQPLAALLADLGMSPER